MKEMLWNPTQYVGMGYLLRVTLRQTYTHTYTHFLKDVWIVNEWPHGKNNAYQTIKAGYIYIQFTIIKLTKN